MQSARIQDVDGIHRTFLMLWKTFSMAFDSLHYTSLSRPWWESAVTQYSTNRIHSSSSSNAHFNFWTNQLLSLSGVFMMFTSLKKEHLFRRIFKRNSEQSEIGKTSTSIAFEQTTLIYQRICLIFIHSTSQYTSVSLQTWKVFKIKYLANQMLEQFDQ